MNSIMERWIGSCRRELLDRTLAWNQRHLMTVLRDTRTSSRVAPVIAAPGPPQDRACTFPCTRPKQAARAVQFVCCITVFLAVRGWFLLRWQVSCTRCVRLLRAALGVSWWTR